jgi:acyl phosphate:glycerol-3-phosphate acyltransferase
MRPGQMTRTALGLGIGFLAGAVPLSNLAARRLCGVDLRRVGTGTISGTALYQVAGFGPLAVAGLLDVAKGAVGPLLVGRRRLAAAALACGLAVAGHDWSPFLGGAGGRGISPSMGALAVVGWPGTALLLARVVAAGRLAGETALGALVAQAGLVPVLAATTRGRRGLLAGIAVLMPRLAGNARPSPGSRPAQVYGTARGGGRQAAGWGW